MSNLFPEQDPAGSLPARPLAGAPTRDGLAPLAGDGSPSPPPEAASPNMLALITPSLIERLAENPALADHLQRALDFQKEVMAHQAEIDFLEAKARIKKKLASIRIVKSKSVLYDIEKNNPKAGQAEAFRYAPLEEIDKHLAPLLAAEGMDLTYTNKPRQGDGGGAVIVGKLRHVKGYFEESEMSLPLDTSGGKSNIQAMGSTNAYGRRYVACNLFNIVVIGDDDNGTGGTIDEAQVAAIRSLLQETGSDQTKFLKYLKAPTIEEIPYRSYPKAMSALEEKRAKEKPSG